MPTASPDDVVLAVRRAVVHLSNQGSRFARRHGLNLTDIRALIVLLDLRRAGAPATPGALAAGIGLASASTTQVVDRLEGRGLVRRRPDPGDRRRVLLDVTDSAVSSGIEAFGPLLAAVRGLAEDRTAPEREVILRFLTDLAELAPEA